MNHKYCVVSNIALRTALVATLRKSSMRIDEEYVTPNVISDSVGVPVFITDSGSFGASFAASDWAEARGFKKISVEEMFELLSPSDIVNYTDNMAQVPVATYCKSKDTFHLRQNDFNGEAFKNLIDWAKGFCK